MSTSEQVVKRQRGPLRSARSLGFVIALAGATLVYACSDDDRPSGTADPGSSGPATSPNASDAASARDALVITPRPDLCEGLANDGNPVAELELPGEAPEALGGEILPGVYELAELTAYGGPSALGPDAGDDEAPRARLTGRVGQATLTVTKFEMRFIEARGVAADDAGALGGAARAVLYRTADTSVLGTPVCPDTAGPSATPYSAVGGSLALFVDPKHRELYVRR